MRRSLTILCCLCVIFPQFQVVRRAHATASSNPALDRNAGATCSSLCSGTPQVVSVSATVTAGTHVVVHGFWCDSSTCVVGTSATDVTSGSISNGTDTFVQDVIDTTTADNGTLSMGYYAYEIENAAGGTKTYTLTFNSSISSVYYGTIFVDSFTNGASGDAYDAHGASSATRGANASCSTSGNLAQSNEFVVSLIGAVSGTAGAGFTVLNSASSSGDDEYLVGGTSGSTISGTWVNSSHNYLCEVSTYKHR